MTWRIRSMQQSDLDCVYAIEQSAHIAPWTRQILSDCVYVGYDCRVIEEKEKVLGFIISRCNLDTYHILNISIRPEQQRKGYGEQLLQEVLDSLKSQTDIHAVILEVRPSNLAALALYQKLGFVQDAIKKAYYKDHLGMEDAIVLKKVLD